MSYLALLVHCLVRKEQFRDEYFTSSGSSHGADHLFSDHMDSTSLDENYRPLPLTLRELQEWHKQSLDHYSRDNICIMRSGWNAAYPETWQQALNSIDEALVMISSPNSKLDWIYCWLNTVNKVPGHVYRTLQQRSKFYPKMWARDKISMLPRHIKMEEMISAMPAHPLTENIATNKPTLRFLTTEILDENFPMQLANFLSRNGIRTYLNDDIFRWHANFASKQMPNYRRATELSQGKKLEPRGPFDEILMEYLSRI